MEEVKTYFADKLPAYEPLSIYRKSNHPDDNYLYSVLAAGKNGTYACWTSWNGVVARENFEKITTVYSFYFV